MENKKELVDLSSLSMMKASKSESKQSTTKVKVAEIFTNQITNKNNFNSSTGNNNDNNLILKAYFKSKENIRKVSILNDSENTLTLDDLFLKFQRMFKDLWDQKEEGTFLYLDEDSDWVLCIDDQDLALALNSMSTGRNGKTSNILHIMWRPLKDEKNVTSKDEKKVLNENNDLKQIQDLSSSIKVLSSQVTNLTNSWEVSKPIWEKIQLKLTDLGESISLMKKWMNRIEAANNGSNNVANNVANNGSSNVASIGSNNVANNGSNNVANNIANGRSFPNNETNYTNEPLQNPNPHYGIVQFGVPNGLYQQQPQLHPFHPNSHPSSPSSMYATPSFNQQHNPPQQQQQQQYYSPAPDKPPKPFQ